MEWGLKSFRSITRQDFENREYYILWMINILDSMIRRKNVFIGSWLEES